MTLEPRVRRSACLLLPAVLLRCAGAQPAPAPSELPAPASAPPPAALAPAPPAPMDAGVPDSTAASDAGRAPAATPEDASAPREPPPTPTRDALIRAVVLALANRDVDALLALTPSAEETARVCASGSLPEVSRASLESSVRQCDYRFTSEAKVETVTGGAVVGPYPECKAVRRSKLLRVTISSPHPDPTLKQTVRWVVRIDEPAQLAGGRWVILDNPRCEAP